MPRYLPSIALVALVFGLSLLAGCAAQRAQTGQVKAAETTPEDSGRFVPDKDIEKLLQAEAGGYRKVHVFVALCDNAHQGIVPVPAGIGNGQDAKSNLYWGARFGVKTYLSRSKDWRLLKAEGKPFPPVLERLIFKHAKEKVYLVADAYDGAYMEETVTEAVLACAGRHAEPVVVDGHTYLFGGGAQLLAFVGHNGLMDFDFAAEVKRADKREREAIFLCCISHPYFTPLLKKAGAYPLLMTTQLMCPEAYTLEAALAGWVRKESRERIHERAAKAYSTYQKCSVKAAKRLLRTGY